MIETKEKIINGSTYSVTQMPARRALKVQARLMKLLGNAFGELLLASQAPEEEQDSFLPKIITSLIESLDEKTFDSFILELVEFYVRKDGKEKQSRNGRESGREETRIADSLLDEIIIWVLISEKMATLKELETHWNFDDALRAYAILEIKADRIEQAHKEQMKKRFK